MDIDRTTAEQAIRVILASALIRLEEVSQIVQAADARAEVGSISDAMSVALDIRQPVYEASRLLDAARVLQGLPEG